MSFGRNPSNETVRNYEHPVQQKYSSRHSNTEPADYYMNIPQHQSNSVASSAYVPREEYDRLHDLYLQAMDQLAQLQEEVEQQARLIQVDNFLSYTLH